MTIIIQVLNKGVLVNYIRPKENKTVFELRHRTKFKELIYGGVFTYYCEDMNFSKSTITIDNRLI
jgi:hypothetical protein